jgi:hypothetical protein
MMINSIILIAVHKQLSRAAVQNLARALDGRHPG